MALQKLRNYIEPSYVGPEASESVSDNPETTQLLPHDCKTISKNFGEKNFLVLKSRFLPIWEVFDFGSIFHRSEKKMKFLTSNAPKKFSGCGIHMFKVSTMSAYIRAFQRTNSRDHTIHRNKMVQEKQKTRISPGFWISLLYIISTNCVLKQFVNLTYEDLISW